MEHSMYTIGKLTTVWQKNPNRESVEEMVMGTEVFYEIAKELQRRTESML